MTTRSAILHGFMIRPAVWCVFFLLAALSVQGGVIELLSDDCISEITAGTGTVKSFIETPAFADIDIEPRYWGDMDGTDIGGTSNPGFSVTKIPYDDFQYNSFKYSFKTQAAADRFTADVAAQSINVIDTDYIKTDPNAADIFFSDVVRPGISEIIITTDRPVAADFVRTHEGEVITQLVHLELTFSTPYAKTREHYELVENERMKGVFEYEKVTRNYGASILEVGKTGADPVLSETGEHEVVPPHTSYLRSSLSTDINVHCPAFAMSFGLAPVGAPKRPKGAVFGDQTHTADLDHYQEMFRMRITHLDVTASGGNDIYIYPNADITLP